jgi:hypothetical protein
MLDDQTVHWPSVIVNLILSVPLAVLSGYLMFG